MPENWQGREDPCSGPPQQVWASAVDEEIDGGIDK